MRLLLLAVLTLAGMLRPPPAAEESSGEERRPPVARPDTILRPDLLAPRPSGPPPLAPHREPPPRLRLGLQPRAIDPPSLGVAIPDPFARLPWIAPAYELPPTPLSVVRTSDDFFAVAVRESIGRRRIRGDDVPAFLPSETDEPRPGVPPPGVEGEVSDFVTRYTELGVSVRGRSELGGDWTRFRPCLGQGQESCEPNLLPQLEPDIDLAVQINGTVAERVSVDVDYDQTREFGASNTISIVYDGEEDDILRRVEVGDVTFRLPRSRFLTQGIPAGNFGFQLEGQLGPVDMRGVWAEQQGDLSSREFRLTGVGSRRRFVQEDTLELDDADYAEGQFFFLIDPREIVDYPHVDVLELVAGSAPPSLVPGIEPIQLYRFENDPAARQQVEGFIQADATAELDGQVVEESGWFRYLVPGQDYYVHPSGLWIALRRPLARDEMLAATYITAAGDTVGTYNPERIYNQGGRPSLELLKASGANHQPGRPTWDREMHQVYRVSTSSDVEPASVEVTISLGDLSAGRTFKRAADGRDVTYLQLFGLDQESPVDRVDPSFVYAPGEDLILQGQTGVQGTFVIFPTLRPFAEPPPNDLLNLTPEEAAELLASDANEAIYENEDPYVRDAGGRFRLTIPYRTRSEGVISSFSLGAIGVLEGSERILIGERALVRGVDYSIDYDVGQVTLLDPEALFATNPDAPVRATWEQRQIFRQAPTSVFGFNAHMGDDERDRLDLLALYRSEKTLVNRPVLGLEPGAALMGGLNGRVERPVTWLDQLLGLVPGLRTGRESSFTLEGEVAVSVPNPNTRGAVFLDDFDTSDRRPLSLYAYEWTRGSAPTRRDGAEAVLPPVLDETTLAPLTWQHTWILESPQGDSVGVHEGFLPAEEIDEEIRVAGSRVREIGLRMRLAATGQGGRRWASITTTLSPTGTDLTKSEFIEFYARGPDDLALVVDLGTASEDAFFVDAGGRTSGIQEDGTEWGLERLDQEANPARGEIWGNEADRLGVWGESCEAEPGRVYRVGDPRANCTRGNGRNDTEDLDGDGNLDTAERSLRYVVELGPGSPYLARDTIETGSDFRLYRIPIRSVLATPVNGPVTEADLRAVRHLRLTLTGDRPGDLTLTRMRIVGSRWIKRGAEGVLSGIVGDTTALGGQVEVGPVSQLTDGDAYASPPGVLEQLSDPTQAVGGQGIEFNEKSLSIAVEGVGPGERAEVYSRFPQRPRDFLSYREARLWVLARSGDWGPDGPASFFLKIGTDPENFYLFRSPLPAPRVGRVDPVDWLPELVIDFGVFQELRRVAEETLALSPRAPGDPPLVLWARDSTYAVVLSDQGRAPNLANVRELSMGVWNRGEATFDGEVWVNELRLGQPVRDAGVASLVEAVVEAGDVVRTRVGLSTRGAFFRQLDENASYQDDRRLSLDSEARLDRMMPAEWGVEVPLTLSMDRVSVDPTFLADTDVRAGDLRELRDIGSSRTRVSLGVRKTTPSDNPVLGLVFDGFETSAAWYRSSSSTVTSRVEAQGVDLRVGFRRRIEPREFDPLPGVIEPLVRWLLPGPIEDAVLGARIRWSPEAVGLGTSYNRQDNEIFRFDRILETPADSAVVPTSAHRETLETAAEVRFRPVGSLMADLTFLSTRDLLPPVEVVSDAELQGLLGDERSRFAGVDIGWETRRSLRTTLRYDPTFVSWLDHSIGYTTRFDGDRNAGFVGRVEVAPGDTVRVLERNVSGEREATARVTLDPGAMMRAAGSSETEPGGVGAWVAALRPVSWTWTDGLYSRFNRDPVHPGLGYQLGGAGRDDYRVLGGDTAATLVDRGSHRLTWGLAADGFGLDATWSTSDVATADSRADRTAETDTWPDVRVRLQDLPVPAFAGGVLDRISLTAGARRSTRVVTYGQATQRRTLVDRAFPLDLSLGWVGGLTTTWAATIEAGDGEDPTGDTERDRTTHTIGVNSAFLPPFGLGRGEPVTLRLIASYTAERECRVPVGRDECVAYVDQLDRALSMTLDTQVSGFDVGLQASYTDRQSYVGQRRGSTQFRLAVFGQFVFEAGMLGRLAPPG